MSMLFAEASERPQLKLSKKLLLLNWPFVVLIVASWDTFFTDFHRMFFEGDSWQFSTSDALIRLFPEQFWFDTAITIGLLTVIGALVALFGAWYWEDRALRRAHQQSQPARS